MYWCVLTSEVDDITSWSKFLLFAIFRYCEEKVGEILLQLLPEEVSPSVLSVCARISRRLAMEKVHTWMSTHITTGEKFYKHITTGEKVTPNKPPQLKKKEIHVCISPEVRNPTHTHNYR